MRAIELAKVAAAAEALRVKRYTRRQAYRLAYAVAAVVFIVALLAMLHALAVVLLAKVAPLWLAICIVLLVDLIIGGFFAILAWRNVPDHVEREAAAVRRRSLAEAKNAATSLATIGEVASVGVGLLGRRNAKSSKLGKAWMIADLASRFVRR